MLKSVTACNFDCEMKFLPMKARSHLTIISWWKIIWHQIYSQWKSVAACNIFH